jgi:OmpA-OmpF porin, OOP family
VNEKIVSAIKAERAIPTTATVRVFGYTDSWGADDINLQLSQRRAESVAQYMEFSPFNLRSLQVKGWGETAPLLYENDLPEGRFYCRAVIIEADSPVVYD